MFTWLRPTRVRAAGRGLSPANRLVLIGTGAAPVSLVGLSTAGWWDLRTLALAVLVPALAATAPVVIARPAARRLAGAALAYGMTATLLYDLVRWGCLAAGWVARDPFPDLGTGLGLEPGWLSGYLWRYLGNGSGLALVFLTIGGRRAREGLVHGLAVCTGLIAVLLVSPGGQTQLFPLTAPSLLMAVSGHVVYGLVLGRLSARLDRSPDAGEPVTRLPQLRSMPG